MANLKLTLACWDYDRTRPLIDGHVKPEGIDLDFKVLRPRQMFPRMLEDKEFHVSELSLASLVSLIGRGDCPFVGIPVPVSKFFRHSCIYVRKDSGICRPQDLRGKRVGTTQYSSTAVTFMRGMLQDEYGLRAQDMHWFMGGLTAPTERPLIPLQLPPEVKLEFLQDGETLEQMIIEGRLDALMSIYIPKLLKDEWPGLVRLFPDFRQVETDYYRRTGIFPVMHTIAMRRDIRDVYPWAARSLHTAFCQARDIAVESLWDTDALRLSLPFLMDHVEENWRVFGKDFWSYEYEANRPALEAIGRYVHEQGFSPRVVKPEEIWPVMD